MTGATVKVAHMIMIPMISASVIAIDCKLMSVAASISWNDLWKISRIKVKKGQNEVKPRSIPGYGWLKFLPEVRFGGIGQFEVKMS